MAALERIGRELLVAIGEDPSRAGIAETPLRFAKWWREFIDYRPGKTETVFDAVKADQMVTVTGVRVWSLCEHHLLPFWCDIAIGYIAKDHILGLSKLARIAHLYAHRLQLQEQLVQQIAEHVAKAASTADVAVVAQGEHLCMTMRGIRSEGLMVSSVMQGKFLEVPAVRAEFLDIAQWKRR